MKKEKSEISESKNTVNQSSIKIESGNIHIGDIVNIHNKKEEKPDSNKITPKIAREIQNLIANNKIKKALEQLLKHAQLVHEDLHSQIIQQSQRWNELAKNEMLGILSTSEAGVIRNRIVYSLLGITKELGE